MRWSGTNGYERWRTHTSPRIGYDSQTTFMLSVAFKASKALSGKSTSPFPVIYSWWRLLEHSHYCMIYLPPTRMWSYLPLSDVLGYGVSWVWSRKVSWIESCDRIKNVRMEFKYNKRSDVCFVECWDRKLNKARQWDSVTVASYRFDLTIKTLVEGIARDCFVA